jgi:hypothetical protein
LSSSFFFVGSLPFSSSRLRLLLLPQRRRRVLVRARIWHRQRPPWTLICLTRRRYAYIDMLYPACFTFLEKKNHLHMVVVLFLGFLFLLLLLLAVVVVRVLLAFSSLSLSVCVCVWPCLVGWVGVSPPLAVYLVLFLLDIYIYISCAGPAMATSPFSVFFLIGLHFCLLYHFLGFSCLLINKRKIKKSNCHLVRNK